MQVLLPSNNIDINPLEESDFKLELSLPYHDSYGDSSFYNIDAAVYELDEVIGQTDTITEVFSTQSFNIKPNFEYSNI